MALQKCVLLLLLLLLLLYSEEETGLGVDASYRWVKWNTPSSPKVFTCCVIKGVNTICRWRVSHDVWISIEWDDDDSYNCTWLPRAQLPVDAMPACLSTGSPQQLLIARCVPAADRIWRHDDDRRRRTSRNKYSSPHLCFCAMTAVAREPRS